MSEARGVVPLQESSSRENLPHYDATLVVRHLAHELRQPLSTMESISYYLEMVVPRQDIRSHQQLKKLQQVVNQAGWILSDAIHFLQASPPRPQLADFEELISDSVQEVFAGDPVNVRLHLCGQPVLVFIDPEHARHLLRSAFVVLRHMSKPDHGLDVRTYTSEGRVNLRLDAHCAVAESIDPQSMFDPFAAHLPAGSGLALASARRIALEHNGDIRVHIAEGELLCLELCLPLAR